MAAYTFLVTRWSTPMERTSFGRLASNAANICFSIGFILPFHFCGDKAMSWHGFAVAIFEIAHQVLGRPIPTVKAICTEDYPLLAPRPANSELDCERFMSAFDFIRPSWHDEVSDVIVEVLNSGEHCL